MFHVHISLMYNLYYVADGTFILIRLYKSASDNDAGYISLQNKSHHVLLLLCYNLSSVAILCSCTLK